MGKKKDEAYYLICFFYFTKNFDSIDSINKKFIISHSKKSKYKIVPGLIDLAAH